LDEKNQQPMTFTDEDLRNFIRSVLEGRIVVRPTSTVVPSRTASEEELVSALESLLPATLH